ncbi:MAG TPA: hypothetical protein VEI97_14220, partial [bacterium]|nr:hypothetical protein [bacterium]
MPRLNQAVIAPPALWLCASALLAGCGGGGGQSPLSPTVEGAGILPPPLAHPGGGTIASVERGELLSIPGGYTLEVTTAPLAARLTPWREIQGIQGNLYDLDIDNFLKGDTITITGVRTDTEANVIIDYAIKHPFPAPNFNNPITGLNRADLGFTGRVLFLTDVPSRDLPARTFFGNVVANTSAVLNADAYMDPGDLLANSTDFNATAFPYKLVVDEAKNGTGNRVGITNGGNPRGNYDPANGGWQRANIGPNRNGWTGYDFLHQGQTARSQLTLAQEAVANNAATLDIAIFIKYTDPRGVGGKTARMPFEPPDPTLFAYRLPNGALDASQIFVSGATYQRVNISQTAASTADLSVKVRDWDARAMETTQAMIQMEPDLSKVNIGTSGTPTLALSIPALAATTVNLTAGSESGIPGDEITYTGTLTNTLGT